MPKRKAGSRPPGRRGDSALALGRLTPSPEQRHGFALLPLATAPASDALRRLRQQQVSQQLLPGSGTQRLGARPHTPRARAAPGEPVPRADWPRPEGGGRSAPGEGLEIVPGQSGPPRRAD
ncbi:hypothetical protein P7K49_023889 [Saguinus oedipus]|uniref:Uncharacterized protein n=1 Tax=Saguinus oedipus TaxID=9490 RepID=A0ABQ9UPL7_SAGOE|nr:hypothetical protein P7K49_023889 [Saguinus oedipus]